jgi:DNA repair protein RecN (Recombination protein N)
VADARRRAAPELAADVEGRLSHLAMADARFEVAVEGDGPADQVTFWLGANRGEPLQPLARSASGGELARVMLALRLATSAGPPIMVFDEVDAGVGGAAATAVGAALAELGQRRQVLVVTHLAQVAAQADHQVAVHKHERDGRTRSDVTALDADARVVEVSRMLSGRPESVSARRHARELLDAGREGR